MPLQERRNHCTWGDRNECYTVNDCSAVVICWRWHSWGQYLGTWSRHCTLHSGEKSPIFGAWSRLNVNIVSQSGSLRAHTFWLDYSPTTVQAIHVSSCLSRSQRENKNLLPIWKSKIENKKFTIYVLTFIWEITFCKIKFSFQEFSFYPSFIIVNIQL